MWVCAAISSWGKSYHEILGIQGLPWLHPWHSFLVPTTLEEFRRMLSTVFRTRSWCRITTPTRHCAALANRNPPRQYRQPPRLRPNSVRINRCELCSLLLRRRKFAVKAKFHYAVQLASRSATSWRAASELVEHLRVHVVCVGGQIPLHCAACDQLASWSQSKTA